MTVWRILGRSNFTPPPTDWRARLATRLGARPRRIGEWAELALFGALACLDDAGEAQLPDDALLSVHSAIGPESVLLSTLATAHAELPMPISFLQSQPGQVLAVLAQHLRWSGNGRCVCVRDFAQGLRMACLDVDSPGAGALLGWVEEASETFPAGASRWLRIAAVAQGGAPDERLPHLPADLATLLASDTAMFEIANEENGANLIKIC